MRKLVPTEFVRTVGGAAPREILETLSVQQKLTILDHALPLASLLKMLQTKNVEKVVLRELSVGEVKDDKIFFSSEGCLF